MATTQATEVADLKQKLELADEDITLINRRLTRHKVCVRAACLCMYTSASTRLKSYTVTCITIDGAATVETLRAELARAKEQARVSDAAAKKADADLKAEHATRRQCQERISTMERELKDATSRCKSLEEDNKAKAAELDMALLEAKEAQSESRVAREEIRQAGEIAAGKPFSFTD